MRIRALLENTSLDDAFQTEHGLSLYIETQRHCLLFDVGASDFFFQNARKMGIDIARADTVVISHGHSDHGGGLPTLLRENATAPIYVSQKAFERHCARRPDASTPDIGLDPALQACGRFVPVEGHLRIDEELTLFSGIPGRELLSEANSTLLAEKDGQLVQDSFDHEQNLLISQGDKLVLVAGCAHCGIANIVARAVELAGRPVDYVIGGFHLHSVGSQKNASGELIERLARRLLETGARYWTCHCTGAEPYAQLKRIMGDRIEYLATGGIIEI